MMLLPPSDSRVNWNHRFLRIGNRRRRCHPDPLGRGSGIKPPRNLLKHTRLVTFEIVRGYVDSNEFDAWGGGRRFLRNGKGCDWVALTVNDEHWNRESAQDIQGT